MGDQIQGADYLGNNLSARGNLVPDTGILWLVDSSRVNSGSDSSPHVPCSGRTNPERAPSPTSSMESPVCERSTSNRIQNPYRWSIVVTATVTKTGYAMSCHKPLGIDHSFKVYCFLTSCNLISIFIDCFSKLDVTSHQIAILILWELSACHEGFGAAASVLENVIQPQVASRGWKEWIDVG
jgi:hypothetical protein